MGKAQGAAGAVDSDYSGRPLRPATDEEIAASPVTGPPDDVIAVTLRDGRRAIMGYDDETDTHGWYLPDEDGWPDYDQPVDQKAVDEALVQHRPPRIR